MAVENSKQSIVFAGGCFWCVEAVFQMLKGVMSVVSGYAGGKMPNPTYEQVRNSITGYAEVIKIEFDPTIITLDNAKPISSPLAIMQTLGKMEGIIVG